MINTVHSVALHDTNLLLFQCESKLTHRSCQHLLLRTRASSETAALSNRLEDVAVHVDDNDQCTAIYPRHRLDSSSHFQSLGMQSMRNERLGIQHETCVDQRCELEHDCNPPHQILHWFTSPHPHLPGLDCFKTPETPEKLLPVFHLGLHKQNSKKYVEYDYRLWMEKVL
jgi:hypothetical protein